MRQKQCADNLIKVHFTFPNPKPGQPGGEYLWARRIHRTTAQIDCIPFGTGKLARGDLVRIDEGREIVEILEHVARTCLLRYADNARQAPPEEIALRYEAVRQQLRQHDIQAEGMFPGICSLSVPNDLSDEQLLEIAEGLGCELCWHEDDEGEAADEA